MFGLLLVQVRAFVRAGDGKSKQELNQSPLQFIEMDSQPGVMSIIKQLHVHGVMS